tara:strand:- start:224 stop:415 length:192 start_codon:yes stop_codon:yes gene_type:complete
MGVIEKFSFPSFSFCVLLMLRNSTTPGYLWMASSLLSVPARSNGQSQQAEERSSGETKGSQRA